jgi:hypothetical protein
MSDDPPMCSDDDGVESFDSSLRSTQEMNGSFATCSAGFFGMHTNEYCSEGFFASKSLLSKTNSSRIDVLRRFLKACAYLMCLLAGKIAVWEQEVEAPVVFSGDPKAQDPKSTRRPATCKGPKVDATWSNWSNPGKFFCVWNFMDSSA